jgi:hypothetical protein
VYDALDDVKAMMAALIRPPPSKQLSEIRSTQPEFGGPGKPT